jgi:hypothetical protein
LQGTYIACDLVIRAYHSLTTKEKALCQKMSLSLAMWPVSVMDHLLYDNLMEQSSSLAGITSDIEEANNQLQGMYIA